MTTLASPLNLTGWIDQHRHLLKPPVAGKCIWEDRDFIVMVAGGPHQRKDFHINPTEELFFQIEGDITLRIIDAHGLQRDIPIRQGELFLLPPNVPHAPQRPAATIGLVVERRRPRGEDDHLRFYCERCNEVVYEESFELKDMVGGPGMGGGQLKRMMDEFWSDATLRTCVHCGTVVTPPSGLISPPSKDMTVPDVRVGRSGPKPSIKPASTPGRKAAPKPVTRVGPPALRKKVAAKGR
jgi:3-hydroxyanthranilate 3,4-dioxygenase